MSERDTAQRIVVGRVELIEALSRRTKMRRALSGVPTTGLREAAFLPALSGIRVEMPGGAHFVWSIEGALTEEVVFDPKSVDRVLKVLISQAALSDRVTLIVQPVSISLHCGSARISMPRLSQTNKRT